MDETPQTEEIVKEPRKLRFAEIKRRELVKPREVLIIVAFVAIVFAVVHILIGNLQHKTDANRAKVVSAETVADIQARNGAAAWALGTPKFQKTYTPAQLTQEFQAIRIATLKAPSLDQQFEGDSPSGRTEFFIYKYSALKVPYYIRVAIQNDFGGWKLTAISGSATESDLEN